jgi:hypothetical protein
VGARTEHPHPQAARLAPLGRPRAEGDQLAVHGGCQRARQLERIALAAAEEAAGAKDGRRNVYDLHRTLSLEQSALSTPGWVPVEARR